MVARSNLAKPLVSVQSRAMGGGKKKPAIPATETNFDVIFVGKLFLTCFSYLLYRWLELYCINKVRANR